MLCAGCDSVLTNASGRVQTPQVRYFNDSFLVYGLKVFRYAVRFFLYEISLLFASEDDPKSSALAAKRRRLEEERERLSAESEMSTERVPFLVSATERVSELFLKHLMSSQLREAFERVAKYREETKHPLIEPTGTEFHFVVRDVAADGDGGANSEPFLLHSRKLPKSTRRRVMESSSVLIRQYEVAVYDKEKQAIIEAERDLDLDDDTNEVSMRLRQGSAQECVLLSKAYAGPTPQQRRKGGAVALENVDADGDGLQDVFANPASYNVELAGDFLSSTDSRVDVRLDGTLRERRRKQLDPVTLELLEVPEQVITKHLLHRVYVEKAAKSMWMYTPEPAKMPKPSKYVAQYGPVGVDDEEDPNASPDYVAPPQGTNLSGGEAKALPRLVDEYHDVKDPCPLLLYADDAELVQRRLFVLEVPKVVFHGFEGPRLFNHVRSLNLRFHGHCNAGQTRLELVLRQPEASCVFDLKVAASTVDYFQSWMAFAGFYQDQLRQLLLDKMDSGTATRSSTAPNWNYEDEETTEMLPDGSTFETHVNPSRILHFSSITFKKWEARVAKDELTGQPKGILSVHGAILLQDEDVQKLRNADLTTTADATSDFLGADARYERAKVLRRYRKRCAKFRGLLGHYLESGEFSDDFVARVANSGGAAAKEAEAAGADGSGSSPSSPGAKTGKGEVTEVLLSRPPVISDVKQHLQQLSGCTLTREERHGELFLNFATSEFLRHARASDTMEIWAVVPAIPHLRSKVSLQEADIVCDSQQFIPHHEVKVQLNSKVFTGDAGLQVHLDRTGVYRESGLKNRRLEFLAREEEDVLASTEGKKAAIPIQDEIVVLDKEVVVLQPYLIRPMPLAAVPSQKIVSKPFVNGSGGGNVIAHEVPEPRKVSTMPLLQFTARGAKGDEIMNAYVDIHANNKKVNRLFLFRQADPVGSMFGSKDRTFTCSVTPKAVKITVERGKSDPLVLNPKIGVQVFGKNAMEYMKPSEPNLNPIVNAWDLSNPRWRYVSQHGRLNWDATYRMEKLDERMRFRDTPASPPLESVCRDILRFQLQRDDSLKLGGPVHLSVAMELQIDDRIEDVLLIDRMLIPPGWSRSAEWQDFRFTVGAAVINFENDDGPRDLIINPKLPVQVAGVKESILEKAVLVGNKWEKGNERHRRVRNGEFDWGGDYMMNAPDVEGAARIGMGGKEGEHKKAASSTSSEEGNVSEFTSETPTPSSRATSSSASDSFRRTGSGAQQGKTEPYPDLLLLDEATPSSSSSSPPPGRQSRNYRQQSCTTSYPATAQRLGPNTKTHHPRSRLPLRGFHQYAGVDSYHDAGFDPYSRSRYNGYTRQHIELEEGFHSMYNDDVAAAEVFVIRADLKEFNGSYERQIGTDFPEFVNGNRKAQIYFEPKDDLWLIAKISAKTGELKPRYECNKMASENPPMLGWQLYSGTGKIDPATGEPTVEKDRSPGTSMPRVVLTPVAEVAGDGEEIYVDSGRDDGGFFCGGGSGNKKGKDIPQILKNISAIDERVTLQPGVSPNGFVYRLSDVFEEHPHAVVGETRLVITAKGGYQFTLPSTIHLRQLSTLQWHCPDAILAVPKRNLVAPQIDADELYYTGQSEFQRYNFILSRFLILIAIYVIMYVDVLTKSDHATLQDVKAGVGADIPAEAYEEMPPQEIAALRALEDEQRSHRAGFLQICALGAAALLTLVSLVIGKIRSQYYELEAKRLLEMAEEEDAGEDDEDDFEGGVGGNDAESEWDTDAERIIAGTSARREQRSARRGVEPAYEAVPTAGGEGHLTDTDNSHMDMNTARTAGPSTQAAEISARAAENLPAAKPLLTARTRRKKAAAARWAKKLGVVCVLLVTHPGAPFSIVPGSGVVAPYVLIGASILALFYMNKEIIGQQLFFARQKMGTDFGGFVATRVDAVRTEVGYPLQAVASTPGAVLRVGKTQLYRAGEALEIVREYYNMVSSGEVKLFGGPKSGPAGATRQADKQGFLDRVVYQSKDSQQTQHQSDVEQGLEVLGTDFAQQDETGEISRGGGAGGENKYKKKASLRLLQLESASDVHQSILATVGEDTHPWTDAHHKVKTTACGVADRRKHELLDVRTDIGRKIDAAHGLNIAWAKGRLMKFEKLPVLYALDSNDVRGSPAFVECASDKPPAAAGFLKRLFFGQPVDPKTGFANPSGFSVRDNKYLEKAATGRSAAKRSFFTDRDSLLVDQVTALVPRLGMHLPAKCEPMKHGRVLMKKLLQSERSQEEPPVLSDVKRARMSKKQLRRHETVCEQYRQRLHPRGLDRKELAATLQVIAGDECGPHDDLYLSLYKEDEETVYSDPNSVLYGRKEAWSALEREEYHAETLAHWFLQTVHFLQQAGADFHPLSNLHAIFNELFWGLGLGTSDLGKNIGDVSLVLKYLKVAHGSSLSSGHLSFLWLVYGDEVFSVDAGRIEAESRTLRKQKRLARLSSTTLLHEELAHEEVAKLGNIPAKVREAIELRYAEREREMREKHPEFWETYQEDPEGAEKFRKEALQRVRDLWAASKTPSSVPWPGFLALVRKTDSEKPAEMIRACLESARGVKLLHVLLKDSDLSGVVPWQPPTCEAHPAEFFRLDSKSEASGILGMMQMRSDRISFERFFSVGGQRISGKSLYVLMHDGSVCVFVMARDRAVRYETLIRAHGMDTVRREIFGYEGSTVASPLMPAIRLRHGTRGLQRWFQSVDGAAGAHRLERGFYEGAWHFHKYHGVGKLMRCEYSKDLKPDTFRSLGEVMKSATDPNKVERKLPEIAGAQAFKRNVLSYDGTWRYGKRHGKGSMLFTRLGGLYRFYGLFLENEPIFGEVDRIDLPEDVLPRRVTPAHKEADPKEGGIKTGIRYYLGSMAPIADLMKYFHDFHFVGAFELYAALALALTEDDGLEPSVGIPTPTHVFHHYVQNFTKTEPNPEMHDLQARLNEGSIKHARSSGYDVEDITEFDLFVLQKLGKHLFDLPTIAACRALDDKRGALLFKHDSAFEVGQRLPFVKKNFMAVTDKMRLHVKKCWHVWHHLDVPCVTEMCPNIVQVTAAAKKELDGTYKRVSDTEWKHIGDIEFTTGSDRKILYHTSSASWFFGNFATGEADFVVEPDAEGKPAFGTTDEGRGVQPPKTGWKSTSGFGKAPAFDYRPEFLSYLQTRSTVETFLSYAPARCVDRQADEKAKQKNATRALAAIPLSGTRQLLQQGILDCKRAKCPIVEVKESIPRAARMAHFEDCGVEDVFAEDGLAGRNFFISLQEKYEAINSQYEGTHALLAEEVRRAVFLSQEKFKAANSGVQIPYHYGQYGKTMQMNKEVDQSKLNLPTEKNVFVEPRGEKAQVLLQDSRADEDSLHLYHPEDDAWNYDRGFLCFQNADSLRGYVQFMDGSKVEFCEGGVPDDGKTMMNFTHERNKLTYDGMVESQMFNGRGLLKSENWSYDGQFKDGLRDGYGKYKAKPTAKAGFVSYEGEWKAGKKHGEGTLEHDEERTIEAMWENDAPVKILKLVVDSPEDETDFSVEPDPATGKMMLNLHLDGDQVTTPIDAEAICSMDVYAIDGSFVELKSKAEGSKIGYTGPMVNGKFEGPTGVLNSTLGKYKGGWRDGLRHGQGTLTIENYVIDGVQYRGTTVSSEWKNDYPLGPCEVTLRGTGIKNVRVEPDRSFELLENTAVQVVKGLCAGGCPPGKKKADAAGTEGGDGGEAAKQPDKLELVEKFFQNMPASPFLGYKGRVELNMDEYRFPKQWPVAVPKGPPSVVDRMREGNEDLLSEYSRPVYRDVPANLSRPNQAAFHYIS
eukprot:g8716.t1